MGLRSRIVEFLFNDLIEAQVKQRLNSISVQVDDSPGWESLSGSGPADRPWADKYSDIEDTLEAWRKNFFVRRLVTLTRSYAVAGGISITSTIPEIDSFITDFWNHPKNRLDRRLGPICNELTRAGEIFPVLFTNKINGMSYVRFVPASQIRHIETAKDDYETELAYHQTQHQTPEPKVWIGRDHPSAFEELEPLMLHSAVNRPVGATRGEGDLTPILPWAKRYTAWLKDRVRLNRIRTRQAVLHIKLSDPAQVEQKRREIRSSNPMDSGIYVSGPDEEIELHGLRLGAADAESDGRQLRLAIAGGANTALHYLGEGANVNYATAREMGEPASRFYTERQGDLGYALKDLITTAYQRFCVVTKREMPAHLELKSVTQKTARLDNENLAEALKSSVQAFSQMAQHGWIDSQTAVQMAMKFAGETLTVEQVLKILDEAEVVKVE